MNGMRREEKGKGLKEKEREIKEKRRLLNEREKRQKMEKKGTGGVKGKRRR